MHPKPYVVVVAAALLVLGAGYACTNKDDAQTNSGSLQLVGRSFLLQTADGYEPVANTKIALRFTDGELSFSAGCNMHSGPYAISNGKLAMHGMSSTEMGCPAELGEQDAWLADFFLNAPTVTLKGDTLTFTAGNVVLTFLDREVADPDRALAGPTWTVDTIIQGTAASTVPSTLEAPTIAFNSDGSFELTTSCNTGGGTYSATTAELAFVGVTFTESACTDTAALALLNHLATVFADGKSNYTIDAARLTIERNTLGIAATASE